MSVALVLAVAVGQTLAPATDTDCWVNPLQVSLRELAPMSSKMRRVVDDHCGRRFDADRLTTGSLRLSGEALGGRLGALDMVYVPPVTNRPADWELALQEAGAPVVLVAGAAIFTTVVVQLIRNW